MTKSRLELFQCLVEEQPQSLYQLAQFLKRDYAGVWRDAKALELNGIIKLERRGEKLKPIALYDRIIFDFNTKKEKL
jgi:predicted transcriptional regulator